MASEQARTPNPVNFAPETAHSGLGQNARTTGGAGILPTAILREVRLGRLKLWDYRTSKLRKTFLSLDGRPVMIAFSPNGKLLAEEGMEDAFHLFDLSDVTQ